MNLAITSLKSVHIGKGNNSPYPRITNKQRKNSDKKMFLIKEVHLPDLFVTKIFL